MGLLIIPLLLAVFMYLFNEVEKAKELRITKQHNKSDQEIATDRLINQIIYALYGLNEEEIAVVEGKA